MTMFTYSFIIPHYNTPDLLTRLLDSIPQREDIQIIVVDDNSVDGKRPIITRSDVLLIQLTAQESKGAGHARNVGLDNAQGKWLLFADADDYYSDGFITELDKFVNKRIDILYFGVYIVDGNRVYGNENGINFTIARYSNSLKNEHEKNVLGLSINEPWNKMFNREFIYSIEARFEEIPLSNDAWFVNYAGVSASTIEVTLKTLYNYILNDSGISKKRRKLSDYYLAMKSNTKRNYLKRQYNCEGMISFAGGIRKKNVLRDYGKITLLKMILYKLITDSTQYGALRRLIVRKTREYFAKKR